MNPLRFLLLPILVCWTFAAAASAQTPCQAQVQKWRPGDVFVGVGNGQWKVFRPCAQTFYDAVNAKVAGANNGAAFDNTWHLLGTANSSQVIRFSISPHDPNSKPSPPIVQSSFDSSNGGTSTNPQAVLVNNAGNIIVANAVPATINVFSPAGLLLSTFALGRNIDRSLAGADLSADGKLL